MTKFAELGIDSDIVKGLNDLGFVEPTPVQKKVIPMLLQDHPDIISLAQTGTGKTAAFGVPLIQQTNLSSRHTQALILCPTRELCLQVANDLTDFAAHMPGLSITAVYGGASIERQINQLQRGAHIIVATPGRLYDMIRRRKVDISKIVTVVLDEADEMLQMGFQDELNAILDKTPAEKNILLFSATMPKGIAALTGKYMNDPVEVTIGKRNVGAENVSHKFYLVKSKDRYAALRRIADYHPDIYSIVFCRTRQETREIAEKLIADGYDADALHGDLSQGQRDYVMNKFREKNLRILVATDVAARGLDVNNLTHVINYNLPDDIANYTHRSGRTGRAGKYGESVVLVTMNEKRRIAFIEKKLKRKFEHGRIPSGLEVCEKQIMGLVESMKQIDIIDEHVDKFLPSIVEAFSSIDRDELIKRLVIFESKRFLDYYSNAPDINSKESEKQKKALKVKKLSREKRNQFTRFYLNVGKKDGVHPNRIIGEINDAVETSHIRIGKIDVMNSFAFLEADSNFTPEILDVFSRLRINGKNVSIEIAREKNGNRIDISQVYQGLWS